MKFGLWPTFVFRDRVECQKQRTVGEIRACHEILDPIQDDGSSSLKEDLILVRVKLSDREATPCRQSTKRVGNPMGQSRDVVEREHVSVVRRDEQIGYYGTHLPPVIQRTVGEIRACHEILDPIQDDGSGSLKEDLILVRVKLSDREATPCRQSTKRVGNP